MGVTVISGVSLVGTTIAEANGLYQRLGLTVVDTWLVVSAIAILVSRQNLMTSHIDTAD